MTQTTPETLSLTVNLDGYNHRASCAPMRRRRFPVLHPSRTMVLIAGLVLLLFSGKIAENIPNNGLRLTVLFLPLFAWLYFIVATIVQIRQTWASVRKAPMRQGVIQVRMDKTGFHKSKPGLSLSMDWALFLDVIDGKDGLLLLASDMEAEPIPSSSIPTGMSQSELKAHIRTWMAAAPPPAT